jgi:hypothetical protein
MTISGMRYTIERIFFMAEKDLPMKPGHYKY